MSQEEGDAEQETAGENPGGESATVREVSGDSAPSAPTPPAPTPEDLPLGSKTGASRKEESPFSFKHFLKRDLSLPTASSSYENTGAKPKIYSNTVHPSPARTNIHQDYKKDGKSSRENWPGADEASSDGSPSIIIKDSKSNFLDIDHCDLSSFRRSHTSNDALGMPSLPDFVQDHLLLEQAYLGSNGPLTVDFDNLPDFTLGGNSNYENAQSCHGSHRDYCDLNASSSSSRMANCKSVPLDLPSFIEDSCGGADRAQARCRPSPLDLPNNLTLDLTDSLNHMKPREGGSRRPCPLDLTGSDNLSGGEPLRLPDFLPTQAGVGSINSSNLSGSRDELAEERRLRINAERELRAALQNAAGLRREVQAARNAEQTARRELLEARSMSARLARELKGAGRAGGSSSSTSATASASAMPHSPSLPEDEDHFSAKRSTSDDSSVSKLKTQISQLQDELSIAHRELDEFRTNQRGVGRSLRLATNTAENSLRELLNGLDQLRGLATSLDPP